MDIPELKEKILNGKSAELKKAIKFSVKNNTKEVGQYLYQAFNKTKGNSNKWALQVELIKALGLLEYKDAAQDVKEIIDQDKAHDMITIAAATALVQLTRKNKDDVSPVINLLDKGISVITGALIALALQKSQPDDNSAEIIMEKTLNINKHPDRIDHEYGLIDPRQYVAISAALWNENIIKGYLNHCIDTAYNINRFGKPVENHNLITVCENSLKGKISKGYI